MGERAQTSNKRRDGLPWNTDLLWYAREAPGALGERSIQSAVEAALRTGGPGKSVASSSAHHDEMIKRLGAVSRARRIYGMRLKLTPQQRCITDVYYTARVKWPPGMLAQLGDSLAGVALAYPPDNDERALRAACSSASMPLSQKLITQAKKQATMLILDAHEAWEMISISTAWDYEVPVREMREDRE